MVPVTLGYYVYAVELFTSRSIWRLDPVHHYLPDAWMGLRIDCTGRLVLLAWTREQTPNRARQI